MSLPLYLVKIGEHRFVATLVGSAPEQWSSARLVKFLRQHGYGCEDAATLVAEAERTTEKELYVPIGPRA